MYLHHLLFVYSVFQWLCLYSQSIIVFGHLLMSNQKRVSVSENCPDQGQPTFRNGKTAKNATNICTERSETTAGEQKVMCRIIAFHARQLKYGSFKTLLFWSQKNHISITRKESISTIVSSRLEGAKAGTKYQRKGRFRARYRGAEIHGGGWDIY